MDELTTIQDAIDRWTLRGAEWSRLDVLVRGAAIAAEVVTDLEAMANKSQSILLTLTEAAHVCGYSADHLGRLVRSGRLKNYGIKGAPRLKEAELPRRPGSELIAAARKKAYDASTDARSLRVRR